MKTIRLTALKLRVEVPDNVHYTDYGRVPSIPAFKAKIYAKQNGLLSCFSYGFVRFILKDINFERTNAATCITFWNSYLKDVSIAMSEKLSPLYFLFCRGHEETHALMQIKEPIKQAIRPLEEMLGHYNIKVGITSGKNSLSECDPEYISNVGGVLAVRTHYGNGALKKLKKEFQQTGKAPLNSKDGIETLSIAFN